MALLHHRRIAALEVEDVVPAIGVEQVREQRRAEQLTHLVARHAGLKLVVSFLRDEVTLHDVDAVRRDHADHLVGHAVVSGATGQRQQGCGRVDGKRKGEITTQI